MVPDVKVKYWKLMAAVAVLMIGKLILFCIDNWTIPGQTATAIDQLNGAGGDFILMQTHNAFLGFVRSYTIPVALIVSLSFLLHDWVRIVRIVRSKKNKQVENKQV